MTARIAINSRPRLPTRARQSTRNGRWVSFYTYFRCLASDVINNVQDSVETGMFGLDLACGSQSIADADLRMIGWARRMPDGPARRIQS